MKKLILILLLCSCSAKKAEKEVSEEKVHEGNTEFLNLFKEVSFDTLHIYSESTDNGGMEIQGAEVPEKFLSYFPEEVRLGATEWSVGPVSACYKFVYAPGLTALIANVPSEHGPTAYNIFLYSDKESKIIYSQRIAENSGDGDYGIAEDSWLLDLNNDRLIDMVTKQQESLAEDEEMTKFSYSDSTIIYLGDKKGFKRVEHGNYNTEKLKVHKPKI